MRTKGFGVMHSLGIIALLFGAAFAQPVFADTYTINFTTVAGSPTPSGSFTYDASAPLGSQFTNFIVDWYGYSIDLTSSANNPSGTGCGTYNSAATFSFLNGSVPCSPSGIGNDWETQTDAPGPGGFALLQLFDDGPIPPPTLGPPPAQNSFLIGTMAGNNTAPDFGVTEAAYGTWTITDTTTPEPSDLILISTGLLAVAFMVRKRKHPGPPSPANQMNH
jgi:hypothetical protein